METNARSHLDPTFPPALLDLKERGLSSCDTLRTRGPWPAPQGIAIVGTRRPDDAAVAFARSLAAVIVDAGLAVWSGGARGIDAAAHEGAMDRGGRTVLVSPSGLDNPYPREHEALFERVLATGGTLVSPFPDEVRPMLGSFHRRNAVLAALTIGTVVVQAGEKSGARWTARAAEKLGRPLYVVPHAPWEERGRGCALELDAGAIAIASGSTMLAKLHDALLADAMHREARLAREHAGTRTLHELPASARRVLDAIGEVPIHMDDLCESTSLSVATVMAALLTLTLGAVVVEAPAGYYRRPTI